jgi:hypothetical protein
MLSLCPLSAGGDAPNDGAFSTFFSAIGNPYATAGTSKGKVLLVKDATWWSSSAMQLFESIRTKVKVLLSLPLVVLRIVIDCAKPNIIWFSSVVLSLCFIGAVVVKDVITVLIDVDSVVALTVIELADRNRSGRTELVDIVVVDKDVKRVVALTVDAVVVDMDVDRVVALTVVAVVVNMVVNNVVALTVTVDAVVVDMNVNIVVALTVTVDAVVVDMGVNIVVALTVTVDAVVVDVDVNIVVALTVGAVVVDMDLDRVVALTVVAVVVNMVMNSVAALTIDSVVVDIDPYSVVALVFVVGIVRAVEVVEVFEASIFRNSSCRALVAKSVQARKFQSSGRLVSLLLWTHDAPRIPAGLPARIGVFCSLDASKSVD